MHVMCIPKQQLNRRSLTAKIPNQSLLNDKDEQQVSCAYTGVRSAIPWWCGDAGVTGATRSLWGCRHWPHCLDQSATQELGQTCRPASESVVYVLIMLH